MTKHTRKTELLIVGAIILLLVVLYCTVSQVRGVCAGLSMLFSQRSVQALQGALNASKSPALMAIFLSFLQTAIFPWYPPRQIIASTACLGSFSGAAFSVIGMALGAFLWLFLMRLLLGKISARISAALGLRGSSAAGVFASLGLALLSVGLPVPAGAFAGAIGISYASGMLGYAAGAIATVLAHLKFCSQYSSLLPSGAVIALRLAGAAMLLAVFIIRRKRTSGRAKS